MFLLRGNKALGANSDVWFRTLKNETDWCVSFCHGDVTSLILKRAVFHVTCSSCFSLCELVGWPETEAVFCETFSCALGTLKT